MTARVTAPTPEILVPALRPEVEARRYGGGLVLEDPVRRVRVPIDEVGLRIAETLAGGPSDVSTLLTRAAAPAAAVQERVALMNRHLLLDTPRAQEALACRAAAPSPWCGGDASQAPLTYPAGLAHGCIACGSCCSGTDVGPLKADDLEKIRSFDWTPLLPAGVEPDEWLVELEGPGGAPVTLLGQRHGRCVFLGADKLCIIHKTRGAHAKPTICRQFPYVFVRTPEGVSVSFAMECRAWWKARQRGAPVETDEPGVRALLAERAPVLEVPLPVPVWDGLDWSWEAWLGLRQELLEVAREATSFDALVEGMAARTCEALHASMAPYHDTERFAWRQGWGLAHEPRPGFDAIGQALWDGFGGGLAELAERCREHQDEAQAERIGRLRWSLDYLVRGHRLEDLARCPEELEIWRDLALASLYAHEPPRRDGVLAGMALLLLQILAGHRLAALTARASLRGRTEEQDVVDSMVLVTKMLRGTAVSQSLLRRKELLVQLFLFNAATFTSGVEPCPLDGRDARRRLPGQPPA